MPLSRRPTENFALDARLELLSALILLARPRRVMLPYGDKVRRHFAPFASHPAVAELRRLLAQGVAEPLFTELSLRPDTGLMTPELAAFFEKARDFSRASGAEAFFRARVKDHGVFLALARAEAAKGQPTAEVSSYLRMPFPGECRFLIAPLLPPAYAANVSGEGLELRVRCGSYGRRGLTFEYDAFDCCPAHELTHTALTPLIEGSRPAFESWPGKPPKACRDAASWSGCVEEHLVRALTLRALKLAGSERQYLALSGRWGRSGYPYLAAVCARLADFEASSEGSFAEFYPRLLACFC